LVLGAIRTFGKFFKLEDAKKTSISTSKCKNASFLLRWHCTEFRCRVVAILRQLPLSKTISVNRCRSCRRTGSLVPPAIRGGISPQALFRRQTGRFWHNAYWLGTSFLPNSVLTITKRSGQNSQLTLKKSANDKSARNQ
jgi:hypothetical protein